MTKKLRIILLIILVALLSCLGVSVAIAKYLKTVDVGSFNVSITASNASTAYAILEDNEYGEGVLKFYKRATVPTPTEGQTIYTDFDKSTNVPWSNKVLGYVEFVDKGIQPTSTAWWFNNQDILMEIQGLEKLDTSLVTDMSCMFSGCKSLFSLDVSGFDTSNVTNMDHMFSEMESCESITFAKPSGETLFDTSNVESMNSVFFGNVGLTTLDLSMFNTAKVTNMEEMFRSCSSLQTIYASDSFVTTSIVVDPDYGHDLFRFCDVLVGGNGTAYDESRIYYTYARIDGVGGAGYFTAPAHTHEVAWATITEASHSGTCSVYGEPVVGQHSWANGSCTLCDYQQSGGDEPSLDGPIDNDPQTKVEIVGAQELFANGGNQGPEGQAEEVCKIFVENATDGSITQNDGLFYVNIVDNTENYPDHVALWNMFMAYYESNDYGVGAYCPIYDMDDNSYDEIVSSWSSNFEIVIFETNSLVNDNAFGEGCGALTLYSKLATSYQADDLLQVVVTFADEENGFINYILNAKSVLLFDGDGQPVLDEENKQICLVKYVLPEELAVRLQEEPGLISVWSFEQPTE